MKVCATLDTTYLPGDYVDDVESTEARCSRCGHTTESFGTSTASERRSLMMLRKECPLGESNLYGTC